MNTATPVRYPTILIFGLPAAVAAGGAAGAVCGGASAAAAASAGGAAVAADILLLAAVGVALARAAERGRTKWLWAGIAALAAKILVAPGAVAALLLWTPLPAAAVAAGALIVATVALPLVTWYYLSHGRPAVAA
ncbi:MAG: hypothetical protein JSU81_01035 [Candidatus Coatesbacteria bacterium]|nr:MAG: hypothetical protein JSU81_01035 [Candidatus Coatesbacteria bacterium]